MHNNEIAIDAEEEIEPEDEHEDEETDREGKDTGPEGEEPDPEGEPTDPEAEETDPEVEDDTAGADQQDRSAEPGSDPDAGPGGEAETAAVRDADTVDDSNAAAGPMVPYMPQPSKFFEQLEAIGQLRAAMDSLAVEDVTGVRDLAAKTVANRLNAMKSTGPRTARGKRRVSMNALKSYSGRLLGVAHACSLRFEPGAAERLYREMVRPYERSGEPLPLMLAVHFHDLARLRLELEAWERIRDAEMEERWRQGKIERRRRLHDLVRSLPSSDRQLIEKGVQGLPESAARAKKILEFLWMLQVHLANRDFDDIRTILAMLYGRELRADTEAGEIICMQCQRLMSSRRRGLSDWEYQDLLNLLNREAQEALADYSQYLDNATMPEAACVARLKLTPEDRAMSLHGERLRQAIDRKQRVIIYVLRVLGMDRGHQAREDEHDVVSADTTTVKTESGEEKLEKKMLNFAKQSQASHLESTKRSRKVLKTKPKS